MNKIALSLSFLLVFVGFTGINHSSKVINASIGTAPVEQFSTNANTYYNSVSNLPNDKLLEGLASLSLSNHKHYTSYDEIRGGNAYSDKDPKNSSKLLDFYTGWSIDNDWTGGDDWNREHVWCQSLSVNSQGTKLFGTTGAGSDIHHIRPSIASINSARNNGLFTDSDHCGSIKLSEYYYKGDKYPEYIGQFTGCYNNGQDYWEPRKETKGDVARILLYVYMHYSTDITANKGVDKRGDLDMSNIVYTSTKTEDAAFDLLVSWNTIDPVDSFEKNRNEYCASVTGVRNPFIDHPEYVDAIWGDGTSTGGGTSSGGNTSGDSSNENQTPDIEDSTNTSTGSDVVVPNDSDYAPTGTYDKVTESEKTYEFRRLKSATGLSEGSKIIIAAKDYNVAMSTTQNTNNRGQTSVTKYTSGDYSYLTPYSSVQYLTVEGKNNTSGFYLNTGSGYLYASSSSSNALKTTTTKDDKCLWTINFNNESAKIVSKNNVTRNTLRYNKQSSLFSCYAEDNTQLDVAIYKEYQSGSTSSTVYTYPEGNSLISISKAIEVANVAGTSHTNSMYKIKGTVSSIDNTTYGNMTIKDSSGKSIYVYGTNSYNGNVKYGDMTPLYKPQVGDTVTLIGKLGLYNSNPQMKSANIIDVEKNTSSSSDLQSLLNRYVSSGKYVKKSVINLNNTAKDEIKQYFHAGISDAKRTTYYNGNALWMTNDEGTINSGYGTDSKGNMTHFKLNSDSSQTVDYTVEIPSKTGMEGFYVTPNDFAEVGYFSNKWAYSYNVGYTYDLSGGYQSGEVSKVLSDFIAVAAPLLLEDIYTSNYITLDKLVIKEVGSTLKLQLITKSISSGFLSNLINESLVLAESTITIGHNLNFN